MVRERVGNWGSAVTSAVAGLVAGLIAFGALQSGLLDGPFFAAQDRLFPAPPPDAGITLVAIDAESALNIGGYPLVSNAYHAQVINYLMSLHPAAILYDFPLRETPADREPPHPDTNQPLIEALTAAASKIVLICTPEVSPFKDFEVGEAIADAGFASPDPGNAVRAMQLQVGATCPENEARESAIVQTLRIAAGIQAP